MQEGKNKRGGTREGSGRKKRYEGGRKLLTISCSEKQKEHLQQLAVAEGLSVSEFILSHTLGDNATKN